jgi:hypothetical protein
MRLVDTSHRSHATCGRVCVPAVLHREFLRKLGGDEGQADQALRAFYLAVNEEWTTGPGADEPIGDDNFAFWRARFHERWGSTVKARGDAPESMQAVAERVMANLAAKGFKGR